MQLSWKFISVSTFIKGFLILQILDMHQIFLTLCCFGVFKIFFFFFFFLHGVKKVKVGKCICFVQMFCLKEMGFDFFNICKNSVLFHVVPLTFF